MAIREKILAAFGETAAFKPKKGEMGYTKWLVGDALGLKNFIVKERTSEINHVEFNDKYTVKPLTTGVKDETRYKVYKGKKFLGSVIIRVTDKFEHSEVVKVEKGETAAASPRKRISLKQAVADKADLPNLLLEIKAKDTGNKIKVWNHKKYTVSTQGPKTSKTVTNLIIRNRKTKELLRDIIVDRKTGKMEIGKPDPKELKKLKTGSSIPPADSVIWDIMLWSSLTLSLLL